MSLLCGLGPVLGFSFFFCPMSARSPRASVSLADVGGSVAGRAGPGPATVCHAACAWAPGQRVASSPAGPPHPGDCVRPQGEPHSGG